MATSEDLRFSVLCALEPFSELNSQTILTALQSCQDQVLNTRELLVLSDEQDNLIIDIADTILPRTASPSASDVKVDRFIDLLLHDVFDEEVKQKFQLNFQ